MRAPEHLEPPSSYDRLKAVAEILARGVLRLAKRRASPTPELPGEIGDSQATCLDDGQKLSLNGPTG